MPRAVYWDVKQRQKTNKLLGKIYLLIILDYSIPVVFSIFSVGVYQGQTRVTESSPWSTQGRVRGPDEKTDRRVSYLEKITGPEVIKLFSCSTEINPASKLAG